MRQEEENRAMAEFGLGFEPGIITLIIGPIIYDGETSALVE